MTQEEIVVGVVVERRVLDNPWMDHVWMPSAILPGMPETEPWTVLRADDTVRQLYAGTHVIHFFSTETSHYRDNLASGSPKVWVSLRRTEGDPPVKIVGVTVDPAEGEAFTEAGDDIVEAVAMPSELAARLAEFVRTYHVERTFEKRRRDAADTETLSPRSRGGGKDTDGHE